MVVVVEVGANGGGSGGRAAGAGKGARTEQAPWVACVGVSVAGRYVCGGKLTSTAGSCGGKS